MATLIERRMIDLGELVEELQGEMETFETARRSPLRLDLISQLTEAIVEQAQLLHQSLHQVTTGGEYLGAR